MDTSYCCMQLSPATLTVYFDSSKHSFSKTQTIPFFSTKMEVHDALRSCRLCLRKSDSLRSLYGVNDLLKKKAESIFQISVNFIFSILFSSIKIYPCFQLFHHPNWPQNVCQVCDEFLDSVQEYKDKVVQNQSELLALFKDGKHDDIGDDGELSGSSLPDIKAESTDMESEVPLECLLTEKQKRGRKKKVTGKRGRPKGSTKQAVKNLPKRLGIKETVTVTVKQENDAELKGELIVDENRISEVVPTKKEEGSSKVVKDECSPTPSDPQKMEEEMPSDRERDEMIQSFMDINCADCSKKGFSNLAALRVHATKIHKRKVYRIRCGICNNVYAGRSKLYQHILFHKNPEMFKCEICDKSYPSKHNLKLHQTTHSHPDSYQFECPICGQRFAVQSKMKIHITRHAPESERKYPCNQCEKRFCFQSVLNHHILAAHSAEPGFVCEVCARPFRSAVSLKSHIKLVHETQPKVRCDQCGNLFANATSLKKHKKSIHEDCGEYPCIVCGHISPNKKALGYHFNRNHTDMPLKHICNYCQKAFRTPKSLRVRIFNLFSTI